MANSFIQHHPSNGDGAARTQSPAPKRSEGEVWMVISFLILRMESGRRRKKEQEETFWKQGLGARKY